MKLNRAVVMSVLFYISEYRTLTKEQIRRMEMAEMCFLRSVTGGRMTDQAYTGISLYDAAELL
jgi:hypothetical protein